MRTQNVGLGAGTNPEPCKPEAAIPAALRRIENAKEGLNKALSDLRARLRDVSRIEPANVGKPDSCPAPKSSQMWDVLNEYATDIEAMKEFVVTMTCQLEL